LRRKECHIFGLNYSGYAAVGLLSVKFLWVFVAP